MADETGNRGALRIQQHYCGKMGAAIYARILGALADGLSRESRTGARFLDWPGEPTRDALSLRLMGGLHALVLAGRDDAVAGVLAGEITEPEAIAQAVNAALVQHDDFVWPWLDGPPQTNEPGRSGALMTGLLEVTRRHGPRIEIIEIGASAGLNMLVGAYRYDLGGVTMGPADAAVTLTPEWRGDPPVDPVFPQVVRVQGCDVAPIDVRDDAAAMRLRAYCWREVPGRLARLDAAIAMLRAAGIAPVQADAADFVETALAEPQEPGVTRVLMHSVVWQYLPEPTAQRIRDAMTAAARHATAARPLAWVAMEPDRSLAAQIVSVKSWGGDAGRGDWQIAASTHAHGAWVKPGNVLPSNEGAITLPAAARVII